MTQSLKRHDIIVLSQLRKNARVTARTISQEQKITHSAVQASIDKLEKKNKCITKYTSLVNFHELGFAIRAAFFLRTESVHSKTMLEELEDDLRINTILKAELVQDNEKKKGYFIEMVFKNALELVDFNEYLQDKGIEEITEHHIVKDITRETLLSAATSHTKKII